MNIFKRKTKEDRIWGKNLDGSSYVTGISVHELRLALEKYAPDTEVCMVVCPKKYWNGGGYVGKLRVVEMGSTGQVWLKGRVFDEALE